MGSGERVTIPSKSVYADAAYYKVVDNAEWAKKQVNDHIQKLTDVISIMGDLINYYNFEPDPDAFDEVNPEEIAPPTRPNFDAVDFNEDWPNDTIPEPVLTPINGLDWSYTAPTAPTAPNDALDFNPGTYSSDMWADLFARVHNQIVNGGTGLTDDVHAAILQRGREAFRVVDDREYRRALAAAGSNGFDFPDNVYAAVQMESLQETLAKETDLINNTTIKDFDVAVDMTKFFTDKAVQIETMLRDFFDKSEVRGLNIAIAAKDFIVKVFDSSVKAYLGGWEGIKIRFEANKTQIEAYANHDDAEIKVYLGRYQALQVKIDAIKAENQGKIDIRNSDANIYNTDIKAYTAEQSAILDRIKVILENNKTAAIISMDEEKLKSDIFRDRMSLSGEMSKAIGAMFVQAAASAYGMINMSMGYDSSERNTESWGHDESLRESHSYSDE